MVAICDHLLIIKTFIMENSPIPIVVIQSHILFIRDKNVMLDRDLAQLYGVKTKRLNEQVRRNIKRFPADFMFQLSTSEKDWAMANFDHLEALKYSSTNPFAFTEHGAVMLASVLSTDISIATSIAVVRAFVELRSFALNHKELAEKLDLLEERYDENFNVVFDALKKLFKNPEPTRRQIGFKTKH